LFFFGDLNFRLQQLTIDQIVKLIDEENYDELLKYDQVYNNLKHTILDFISLILFIQFL
jgi:hypothetical protein